MKFLTLHDSSLVPRLHFSMLYLAFLRTRLKNCVEPEYEATLIDHQFLIVAVIMSIIGRVYMYDTDYEELRLLF